jgi:hypothetical protein
MGQDYASSSMFAALRYCVDSAEFAALSGQDPAGLVELCAVDDVGVVRRAAQELHILSRLIEYRGHSFPKPGFPLSREYLSAHFLFHLFSWLLGLFLTNLGIFTVEGTKITQQLKSCHTLVVLPQLTGVRSPLFFSVTPVLQGKWQLCGCLPPFLSSQVLFSRVHRHSGSAFCLCFLLSSPIPLLAPRAAIGLVKSGTAIRSGQRIGFSDGSLSSRHSPSQSSPPPVPDAVSYGFHLPIPSSSSLSLSVAATMDLSGTAARKRKETRSFAKDRQ